MPQNLGLYRDLTVAENLRFSRRLLRRSPSPASPRPRPVRGCPGRELPLGTQRQVAFAAALSHRPELLLLDEPTSGVDALSRARLWDVIRGESDQGVGVLVTTHYMEEAQECDRLLLMAGGRLVAQGSEADIIGPTSAVAVRTDDWAATFSALNASGVAVSLNGRAVRVAGARPDDIRQILGRVGITAEVDPVPATIEERMMELARSS